MPRLQRKLMMTLYEEKSEWTHEHYTTGGMQRLSVMLEVRPQCLRDRLRKPIVVCCLEIQPEGRKKIPPTPLTAEFWN